MTDLHIKPIKQEAWYLQIKNEIHSSKRPIDKMSIAEIRKMYQENNFVCDTCGNKFEKNNFTLEEHITHLINPIVLWSCEDCIMKDLKQGNIIGTTEEPKPKKAAFAQTCQIDMDASPEHSGIVSSMVNIITHMAFASIDNAISMQTPVQVKNNVIKIKEHLMKENTPYAFTYQGKDYVISKTKGTTQLFELRD